MSENQPLLFRPLKLRGLTLPNRIVVSPMCQYSAVDGCAQDWHLMHIGNFAVSGVGMVIVEMTNVQARGRISPGCMGLYSDANEAALKRVVDFCMSHAETPIAIQLAHAGRKGSARPPWAGRAPISMEDGGWETVGPSAIPVVEGKPVPRGLTVPEIEELVEDFARATERAARIGFDAIELHAAHGYLLHQFLSPLANQREDDYGGSLENRMRFPLAVFKAMRAAWPEHKPLGVRVSATDYIDGGWDVDQTLSFTRELLAAGADWIDVSSAGLVPAAQIEVGPGYQVPFAERVRKETGATTMTVGMITEPGQAEAILAEGKADLVAMAREMLYNPRWAWHAAQQLGGRVTYPDQYLRTRPWMRNDLFGERSGQR